MENQDLNIKLFIQLLGYQRDIHIKALENQNLGSNEASYHNGAIGVCNTMIKDFKSLLDNDSSS